MAFCTKCGAQIHEGSQFCTECGTRVSADNVEIHSATEIDPQSNLMLMGDPSATQVVIGEADSFELEPEAEQPITQNEAGFTTDIHAFADASGVDRMVDGYAYQVSYEQTYPTSPAAQPTYVAAPVFAPQVQPVQSSPAQQAAYAPQSSYNYQAQPEPKKHDASTAVIAIVAIVIIAAVAIGVILVTTGVIGGDSSNSHTVATTTTTTNSSSSTSQSTGNSNSAAENIESNTATYKFTKAKASSQLSADKYTYDPGNVVDGTYTNCWSEGASGSGVGEWIELSGSSQTVHGISIINGLARTEEYYYKNARPKKITLTFSDGSIAQVTLEDTYRAWQDIQLNSSITTSSVRITIESVYEGSTYSDCCITAIKVY